MLLKVAEGLCPALTQNVIEVFYKKGCRTVSDLISKDAEELSLISEIPYKDVVAIQRVLLAQYAAVHVTGVEVYEDTLSSVAIYSTGCSSLDNLLDGGLYGSEITEIVGPAASAKSQICLCIALTVSRLNQQNVVFIDTNGSFDMGRIQDILESSVDTEEEASSICSRIKCFSAHDVFELLSLLSLLKQNLNSQDDSFYSGVKLLILDCVTSVISPILGGSHSDGHGMMMHVARSLKNLCVEFSLAVLVTNNMVGGFGGSLKPALGRSWQYVPNVRVEIRRAENKAVRIATLTKSARQETNTKCYLTVTDSGIEDWMPS